jgi:PAS domain S-box-containing protein
VTNEPRAASSYEALLEEAATDLYENAPCGYLSANADGVILRVNETFCTLTGYRREDVLGSRRFLDLLTAGGRIFYETHLRPLLRMQGFVREIALDLVRADGGQLPVIVNALERRSPNAEEHVIRLTLFDATDRRRYERELVTARHKAEEAAQARSDLIAMVSHDVRAPLSALLTATAMLSKTAMSPQQERYLRIVESSATHALTLLNSILDLSSLEAGHTVLREKVFDPRQLIEQAVASGRLTASSKPDLTVTSKVDESTPRAVIGDPDKIGQVLLNLVGNAVKFTERGFVTVMVYARRSTTDTATLEFVVSDTGIGIPADRLPHIFEEFTQASAEIGEKYGGSGLGLAISRKLLRLYGSLLHVTSTVGQGTTFSFELQLKRPPA